MRKNCLLLMFLLLGCLGQTPGQGSGEEKETVTLTETRTLTTTQNASAPTLVVESVELFPKNHSTLLKVVSSQAYLEKNDETKNLAKKIPPGQTEERTYAPKCYYVGEASRGFKGTLSVAYCDYTWTDGEQKGKQIDECFYVNRTSNETITLPHTYEIPRQPGEFRHGNCFALLEHYKDVLYVWYCVSQDATYNARIASDLKHMRENYGWEQVRTSPIYDCSQ